LPTASADDANAPVAGDGKAGTALIQEFRFNQYCMRLQALIVAVLDVEFKAFLKWSGVNIDTKLFDLKFNVPQNFATYRQAELDQVKIGTFSQLEGYGYFSKRFLMSKYLGMSADDMVENDMMWREENKTPAETSGEANGPDLRNIGITPGGIEGDLENLGPVEGLGEESLEDAEGMPEGPGGAGGGAAGGDTGGAAGGEAGGPSAGGGPGLQP